jgi:hypothetical protein
MLPRKMTARQDRRPTETNRRPTVHHPMDRRPADPAENVITRQPSSWRWM